MQNLRRIKSRAHPPPFAPLPQCVYHETAKMVFADAADAHKLAHAGCHDERTRCECDYCADGACLEDDVYTRYQGVAEQVLCAKDDSAGDFKYACIKGLCKSCGWFKSKSVKLSRKIAKQIMFDDALCISDKTDKVTLAALKKVGIAVGHRPVSVTSEGRNPYKIGTKTAFADQAHPMKGDTDKASCTILFDDPAAIRDGPDLGFARCPQFRATGVDGVTMRKFGTKIVPRAKPVRTKDDEVLTDREVQVIVEEEVKMGELSDHLIDTSVDFFSHAWIAHHQADKFDECLDNLPTNAIAILMDFSMVSGTP